MLKFEAPLCYDVRFSELKDVGLILSCRFLHRPMELLQRFRVQEGGEHPFQCTQS